MACYTANFALYLPFTYFKIYILWMFPQTFVEICIYLWSAFFFKMKFGVWLLSYMSIIKFIHKRNVRILVYSEAGKLEHKRILTCGHIYLLNPSSHVYETWYSALPLGEVDSSTFPKTHVHGESRHKLSRKFSVQWKFVQTLMTK